MRGLGWCGRPACRAARPVQHSAKFAVRGRMGDQRTESVVHRERDPPALGALLLALPGHADGWLQRRKPAFAPRDAHHAPHGIDRIDLRPEAPHPLHLHEPRVSAEQPSGARQRTRREMDLPSCGQSDAPRSPLRFPERRAPAGERQGRRRVVFRRCSAPVLADPRATLREWRWSPSPRAGGSLHRAGPRLPRAPPSPRHRLPS